MWCLSLYRVNDEKYYPGAEPNQNNTEHQSNEIRFYVWKIMALLKLVIFWAVGGSTGYQSSRSSWEGVNSHLRHAWSLYTWPWPAQIDYRDCSANTWDGTTYFLILYDRICRNCKYDPLFLPYFWPPCTLLFRCFLLEHPITVSQGMEQDLSTHSRCRKIAYQNTNVEQVNTDETLYHKAWNRWTLIAHVPSQTAHMEQCSMEHLQQCFLSGKYWNNA